MTPPNLTPEQHNLIFGLPSPRKADVLFRSDLTETRAHASLDSDSSEFAYSRGYRTAARLLTEHVLEAGLDKNSLVFPILNLYRHHIELILKRLIVTGAFLVGKELSTIETERLLTHRLDQLWSNFCPILEAVCDRVGWTPPTQEDIEGIHSYIQQMTKVDPDGQSSRYSVSKKGDRSIPHVTNINLRVFADGMERLGDSLERLDAGFLAMEEIRAEHE